MSKSKTSKIRDVAQKAGVSHTTVSRFFNDPGRLKESTATKIRQAVAELRYKPNHLAKSFHSRKTNNIAILLGSISSPMSALTMQGIESVTYEKRYSLTVCNTNFSGEREKTYIEMLMGNQVDGMIIAPCSNDAALLQEVLDRGIALLFVERHVPGIRADYVCFNFYQDSRTLTRHLLEQGCKRIAVIFREVDEIHNNPHLKGFYDALFSASISREDRLIFPCHSSAEAGYEAMQSILSSNNLPDAVYVTTSVLGTGVLQCCREKSVDIPDDLLLACFDSFGAFDKLLPISITCNEQPAFALGVTAAETLFQRLEQRDEKILPFRNTVLSGKLRIGESSTRRQH